MGISIDDVRIDGAQANSGEGFVYAAASQRSKVEEGDGNRRDMCPTIELNDRLIRRVLNHVEREIPEVPIIRHAVPAAQAGLAIAKDVPGDAETRREVIRVQVPQFANR